MKANPDAVYTYQRILQGEELFYVPVGADGRYPREKRNAMWVQWQRLGLPIPDPKTGRCNFFIQPHLAAASDWKN